MATLAVVSFGTIPVSEGVPVPNDKMLSGLGEYVRRWPGRVVWAGPADVTEVKEASVMTAAGPLEVIMAPQLGDALARTNADLAYVPDKNASLDILESGIPFVLCAEFTPQERVLNASVGRGLLGRLRIRVGALRAERDLKRLANAAIGIQCNGYPSYDYYSRRYANVMLYFDARIAEADVHGASQRDGGSGEPLQLAFSGRIIAHKGADHALRAATLAHASGVDLRLHYFGRGELEEELKKDAPEWVTFHGFVPYDTEWKSVVGRDIDAMLLPHVQGDPSCTYLEAAGLGVPTIGFANRALDALVRRHGIGWTAPVGDDAGLARLIAEADRDRGRLSTAGRAGLEFMAQHPQEAEFDRRVQHLLAARSHTSSAPEGEGVSIVIPFYGDPAPTLQLIDQLKAQQDADLEIIVADDASPTPFPPTDGVRVVRRRVNGGFGSAVNTGAREATRPLLLVLNSDLEVAPTFVRDLVAAAGPSMPCVAGCVLREPSGHAAYTARRFPVVRHHVVEWLTPLARFKDTDAWHRAVGHEVGARPGTTTPVDWVVGAVLLMPTKAFRDVGGFDERFYMNSEEVDLQRRLTEAGVPSVYVGSVECLHEGGGSSASESRRRWVVDGRYIYADKWNGRMGRVRMTAALSAATAVNYLVNSLRERRGAALDAGSIRRSEGSLLRERMKR